MPKRSSGILMYRQPLADIELLLVHPGGPLWARKDLGAWSIPKGEYGPDEDPEHAARREFEEETGDTLETDLIPLGEVTQKGGKRVLAFAAEGDFDPKDLHSNTFPLEWPPRSGKTIDVPEVDRAAWFDLEEAGEKLLEGQKPFLERLRELNRTGRIPPSSKLPEGRP